jgi:hypothetical protein
MPNSQTVNVTLSVTVPRNDQGVAVRILSEALGTVVADIPDLVSGNVAIFGDDFAEDTVEDTTEAEDAGKAAARRALDRAGFGHVPDDGKLP